jgi:hypothetical protein
MRSIERFENEFSGFSGGASGFGDPEFVESLRQESAVPGTGLSVGTLQSVARRQLVGSIVVAAIIAVVAGFSALRPIHSESEGTVAHNFATVQQPVLATPRLAAAKHATELP